MENPVQPYVIFSLPSLSSDFILLTTPLLNLVQPHYTGLFTDPVSTCEASPSLAFAPAFL